MLILRILILRIQEDNGSRDNHYPDSVLGRGGVSSGSYNCISVTILLTDGVLELSGMIITTIITITITITVTITVTVTV